MQVCIFVTRKLFVSTLLDIGTALCFRHDVLPRGAPKCDQQPASYCKCATGYISFKNVSLHFLLRDMWAPPAWSIWPCWITSWSSNRCNADQSEALILTSDQSQIEVLEMFTGWESKNKYRIFNTLGQDVFFAREDNDCCTRCCCGPGRPFDMNIVDNIGREIIHIGETNKTLNPVRIDYRLHSISSSSEMPGLLLSLLPAGAWDPVSTGPGDEWWWQW